MTLLDAARRRWGRYTRRRNRPLARDRYEEGRLNLPLVERLSDTDLQELNELLPWNAFIVDAGGRPFGRPAWTGKRVDPQQVPDPRIARFDERFGLAGKHVLEIGSFEGVHTAALCERAGSVTAVDARIENVVKTIVRCAFMGHAPTVLLDDVESPESALPDADLCHHIGVLYHLADPVTHLRRLGPRIGHGLMLDTHIAAAGDADAEYTVDGRAYRYHRHVEGGRNDPFSGTREHAKWLLLADLEAVLHESGFGRVEVVEQRTERNGPRVLLFAERETRRERGRAAARLGGR